MRLRLGTFGLSSLGGLNAKLVFPNLFFFFFGDLTKRLTTIAQFINYESYNHGHKLNKSVFDSCVASVLFLH